MIASKLSPGTDNRVPSLCSPISAQAYSISSANIIRRLIYQLAMKSRVKVRANILDFESTNLMRFLTFMMAPPPEYDSLGGDIARLGAWWDSDDPRGFFCGHKFAATLNADTKELAARYKFSDALYKKTNITIGAFHKFHHARTDEWYHAEAYGFWHLSPFAEGLSRWCFFI